MKTVISGMGICCSAGRDLPSVWKTLLSSEANCTPGAEDFFAPHTASPLFSVKCNDILSCCLRPFIRRLVPGTLDGINRTTALALVATAEALSQAGLDLQQLSGKRVGIALGTTVGCTFHNEPYYIRWKNGQADNIGPVLTYLQANIAERLQSILGLAGPRAVVTNACASGTDAIGLAKNWLAHGLCDIAIAGGTDEISRIACHGFSSLMLFSHEPCRPFDRKRNGLNLGEGAGILILEPSGDVDSRDGQTLGILRGYSAASDAYHPTAPHPEGRGLQTAIGNACRQAGIELPDICYINAHGTGTSANDKAELTALIKQGITPQNCPLIHSSKGATGHTLGAAGGIEAVITLQSLRLGYACGSTGCKEIDPDLPLPVLRENEGTELKGNLGMSQSLAFGGGNSALVFEGVRA